jgi:hypothetical protein
LNAEDSAQAAYAVASTIGAISNFTLSDYLSVLARFSGQISLFNINGFFLPGMLIAQLVQSYLNRRSNAPGSLDSAIRPLVGFLTLSLLGVAGFVAVFFQISFGDQLRGVAQELGEASFNNRVDHWIYGRYTDVFLPVFLLCSAFYLDRKSLLISLAATVVLACVTVILAPAGLWAPNYVNILALWPFHLPALYQLDGFVVGDYLLLLLVVAGLGNFLISLLFLKSRWLPFCIAAVFLFSLVQDLGTTRNFEQYTVARYDFSASLRARLTEGSCIYADTDSFEVSHGMYAFALWPHRLFALNAASDNRVCEGLITLRPEKFEQQFERVTGPSDKFTGMVRK